MISEDAALAVPVSVHDHIQGNAHAVVTLVEYGDFQCQACGMAYPLVKQIQQRYTGNLRLVFRHFPLSQAHPYAQMAAELAEAAAVEGQFWEMHDWLYENQDNWTPYGGEGLEAGVRALGLDEQALAATMRNADIAAHVRRDFMGGVRSGVNGTPSFYVNGYLYQGDFDALAHAIGRVIARQA
ncbi:MAG: DsbA family protein [Rhodanobacter sp.]